MGSFSETSIDPFLKDGNFLCLSSPSVFLALQDGRFCPGGDTPRISCGGVPPGSSNPDPISDYKI